MLKIHDIFLRKFILLFIFIFFGVGIILYFWIKDIYIEQTKSDLLHNIDIISLQVKDLDNTQEQVKQIKKILNLRITIIDSQGNVIAESDKDFRNMDNHKNRAEIIQAKFNKFGYIIRYSHTLKKELLYVAKKYNGK